jgi:ubiquinone biosynthesis monooxygenase Coq7
MNRRDRFIVAFDLALRTVFSDAHSARALPGAMDAEAGLSSAERRHAAALMRVNHAGEVCAQALYQGQALSSGNPALCAALQEAAQEETEHLAWTAQRIRELGGRKSVLNPFWYAGALGIGLLAGKCKDKWNLGFLAETERQVEAHLERHLERLPKADERSRKIVAQMKADEIKHAESALRLGGAPLPKPLRALMRRTARLMTQTAYYL